VIVLFWVTVAWIAYVYVGYPLILWLLGLMRKVEPDIRSDHQPSVSVLIAAWNEERDIAWKLTETLGWDYPAERLQVLVASDGSEDRTDQIVRSMTDPRLTFVRMEQRGGKSAALNRLAQLARGDILFFTDANSHIEPGALRRIARHFADPRVGCVTGEMHYRDEGEESAVSDGTRVYWGYEALIKQLESRIGSVLVCVGSVFAIRTALFEPLHPEVANDLELPLRIGRTSHWLRYEPTVRSVERPAQTGREEFSRQRRIVAQGALALWRLRTQLTPLRAWQFFSRKVLRWLTGVPLVLLLVSTAALAHRAPFGLLLAPQVAFWVLALVGYFLARAGLRPGRLFAVPFYVVLVAFAGVMGVIDACAGRRFRVWETATLSRGGVN
jgi:cellulose synthase/poly-beta-1,6-N-acetylglucosamine synthase-like glycosyltransferase